jgi:hypothetical protein
MTAMLGSPLDKPGSHRHCLGPFFIGSSGLMTMDPFDQMWWTLGHGRLA